MSVSPRLAFIGCGAMGAPIAERLIDVAHELCVYDPNPAATAPLVARGAIASSSLREAANGCEVAFACLPSPEISLEVALGAGGIAKCRDLGVYVEMSTIGSRTVKDIASELGKSGIAVLDAPVSGGPRGARARPLSGNGSG